jgi:hypothetical protein
LALFPYLTRSPSLYPPIIRSDRHTDERDKRPDPDRRSPCPDASLLPETERAIGHGKDVTKAPVIG